MRKHLISMISLALITASLPQAAGAEPYDWRQDDPHRFHEHDRDRADWYHHPYWWNGRYIVAPVPPPVVVTQPYYYGPTPGASLSINIGN